MIKFEHLKGESPCILVSEIAAIVPAVKNEVTPYHTQGTSFELVYSLEVVLKSGAIIGVPCESKAQMIEKQTNANDFWVSRLEEMSYD